MRFDLSVVLLGIAGLATAFPLSNVQDITSRNILAQSADTQPLVQRDVQVFEEIDVYVDSNGTPVSSSTRYSTSTISPPTPTSKPQLEKRSVASSSSDCKLRWLTNYSPTAPAPTSAKPTSAPAAAPVPVPATNNAALGAAALTGSPFTLGVTYTQYHADGSCRSAADVKSDITHLVSQGYDLIRLYGSDCNGPQNLFAAIKGKKVWMFLGIYDPTQASAEAQSIATQLDNDWSQVHTISVGNEVVNAALGKSVGAQQQLVGNIVSGISAAKGILRQQGYKGPIVNVDTMVAVQKYPQLCTESDYCAMNCHAFFDGGRTASEAGAFVDMFVGMIKQATGKDRIVITETGWPTCGANGVAVGSDSQQALAVASLKAVTSADIILFSGYNEPWKTDTTGTEHCWGQAGNGNGS